MATIPLLRAETSHSVFMPMEHLGQSLSAWERAALVVSQPVYRISEAVIRAQCTPIQPGIWDNETLERIRRIAAIYGNVHFKSLHPYAHV